MDIICFSHLRWNFVFQRPQHLLSRAARTFRTFYIEESVTKVQPDGYDAQTSGEGVIVVVPVLDANERSDNTHRMIQIIHRIFFEYAINDYLIWYYTPMALPFTEQLSPKMVVFDCMDELSAFKFAPAELRTLEKTLLAKADVVFTGGESLYQAKRTSHSNIYSFPSSIEKEHFIIARQVLTQPDDQKNIPHPRLGFFGVIDERFDIELIAEAARQKPGWHFILVGPIVKIDPASLPYAPNIHYLGPKTYKELPVYLSGWDIALIPFAINESTRFISPTKTPEYLAAGKPVISTPIQDVINPYGKSGLVHIVGDADSLIIKAMEELAIEDKTEWLQKVDKHLESISWDNTWSGMLDHINNVLYKKSDLKNNRRAVDYV